MPELASRAHAAKIATVVNEALGNHPVDCIAFASGPGLPGGLMVGRVAAETLANFKKVPILGVNHLEGHIFACDFEGSAVKNRLEFPLVALVVSGGIPSCGTSKATGSIKSSARRATTPPAKRLTRWPNCWGWLTRAGRRFPGRRFRAGGTQFIFRVR